MNTGHCSLPGDDEDTTERLLTQTGQRFPRKPLRYTAVFDNIRVQVLPDRLPARPVPAFPEREMGASPRTPTGGFSLIKGCPCGLSPVNASGGDGTKQAPSGRAISFRNQGSFLGSRSSGADAHVACFSNKKPVTGTTLPSSPSQRRDEGGQLRPDRCRRCKGFSGAEDERFVPQIFRHWNVSALRALVMGRLTAA